MLCFVLTTFSVLKQISYNCCVWPMKKLLVEYYKLFQSYQMFKLSNFVFIVLFFCFKLCSIYIVNHLTQQNKRITCNFNLKKLLTCVICQQHKQARCINKSLNITSLKACSHRVSYHINHIQVLSQFFAFQSFHSRG